jgi:hypothetical protein
MMRRPLHVVQISRDADLLRPLPGAEPVERQIAYARELERQAPGSVLTIIVIAPRADGRGWQRHNARIVPVGGFLRGCVRCLKVLLTLHRRTPISVITTQVPYDEAWLALAVGRWHGIPVIGQIHSDLLAEHAAARFGTRLTAASRRWATRKALRAFAVVRTVSSAARTSIATFAGTLPVVTISDDGLGGAPGTGARQGAASDLRRTARAGKGPEHLARRGTRGVSTASSGQV